MHRKPQRGGLCGECHRGHARRRREFTIGQVSDYGFTNRVGEIASRGRVDGD
jgi:hypothetical protein